MALLISMTHVLPLCSRGGLNKGVPKGTWEEDLEKICTLNKLKSKRFLASDMRSYRNHKQLLNQQSWDKLQGKCIRTCTSDKLIIRKCKVALSDKSVWAFRHHNPLVILISCARTAVYILPYVSTSTIKHQGKRYTKQAPLKHYIKLASNICTKKMNTSQGHKLACRIVVLTAWCYIHPITDSNLAWSQDHRPNKKKKKESFTTSQERLH